MFVTDTFTITIRFAIVIAIASSTVMREIGNVSIVIISAFLAFVSCLACRRYMMPRVGPRALPV